MWLVLHYHDNSEEVLVNMDNIIRVSNRDLYEYSEKNGDHTILVSGTCQIHVKESIEEIYQMIRSKS